MCIQQDLEQGITCVQAIAENVMFADYLLFNILESAGKIMILFYYL